MAVADVLIFRFIKTWNLEPNRMGVTSLHKLIWGRNYKEALASLDAAFFTDFFFACSIFYHKKKRTNKRKKSILILTHYGPQPVHHVTEKMLMLAAVILRWWIKTKNLHKFCHIWEQPLDCSVHKVCLWHGRNGGNSQKLQFLFAVLP